MGTETHGGPVNMFLVGISGERIGLLRHVPQVLSRGEALNLAVWLATIADPDSAIFNALLKAVRNS